jgi:hypothetical protein
MSAPAADRSNEVLFRDGDADYDPMVRLEGRVAVLTGAARTRASWSARLP